MISLVNLSITFSFLLSFSIAAQTEQPNHLYHFCPNTSTFVTNSTYHTNLNHLFASLSSNANNTIGFYNVSSGRDPNEVYGLFLCRGDVRPDVCQNCVTFATQDMTKRCPLGREAFVWYDECLLRYSNISFFSTVVTSPMNYIWEGPNISDQTRFNQLLATAMRDIAAEASSASGAKKVAVREVNFTEFKKLYSLGQCSGDLSSLGCAQCLQMAISLLPTCCSGKRGGRVFAPSCIVRYEIYPFYNATAVVSPPPPPIVSGTTPTAEGESNSLRIVIIVVVIIATFAVLAICTFIFMKARKKGTFEALGEIEDVASLQFDFGTIRTATNDFSEANRLGEGGFGAVYKGRLPDGQVIAVKRLSRKPGGQGDLEFKNEVQLVAKLQHRHLVRLLGFCSVKEERLLIYEFVPNSSLNNFIFDPIKRGVLDWETRYKIIVGTARGLVYLHEDSRLRIIHRDLKPNNILLDEEMNPKISDFGMAKLFAVDQTQDDTSRIVGTFGYMPPEYVYRGHFSVKSDVYSFGVLMLEIVSGHKNSGPGIGEEEEDLLAYVWRNWNEGTSLNVIDPTLTGGSRNEIMRCIHIGLLCVQENEANRPTMGQIITMLSSQSITSPAPLKPAFFQHSELRMGTTLSPLENNNSRLNESNVSANKKLLQSNNEASISELEGR